jgi:hypothetical protein
MTGNADAHPLREHGFWDYTTPGAGSMEQYAADDYATWLDDMAAAGMNSLLIVVKWITTGYRSRLPFLDQAPDNPVIASNNRLLRQAIEEAGKRRIKIWLGAVLSYYPAARYAADPYCRIDEFFGGRLPESIGEYDADAPGYADRAARLFEELVELFPGIGGLMVEMEWSGRVRPHRIPLYNQWAAAHGRTRFERLCQDLSGRGFDLPDWRDYATARRVAVIQAIECAVRAKGFAGDLTTIAETGRTTYSCAHEMNLATFRKECPGWSVVTYEYEKWEQRFASMDFCVSVPRQHGLDVNYLPRGVMTWSCPFEAWPRPMSLAEGWRLDVEDIRAFRPERVWWFGAGGTGDGAHFLRERLQSGQDKFASGRAARLALIRATAVLNGSKKR